MVRQLSYFRDPKPAAGSPLEQALTAVPESVRVALEEAARRLRALGIRHALVGGLAVGAHGAPRNTTDVEFLVGPEAFEGSGAVLTHRSGVPVKVYGQALRQLQGSHGTVIRVPSNRSVEVPLGEVVR